MSQSTRVLAKLLPTSAGQAAKTILDGVKAEKWRILVGDDAHVVDRLVRESPEDAYGPEFLTKLRENSTLDVFTKTE